MRPLGNTESAAKRLLPAAGYKQGTCEGGAVEVIDTPAGTAIGTDLWLLAGSRLLVLKTSRSLPILPPYGAWVRLPAIYPKAGSVGGVPGLPKHLQGMLAGGMLGAGYGYSPGQYGEHDADVVVLEAVIQQPPAEVLAVY